MSNINSDTINRFIVLTPFQKPITYLSRNITGGVGTDDFTHYDLSTSRTRDVDANDVGIPRATLGNAAIKWVELWLPILTAASCPNPKKDDRILDENGVTWTVFKVKKSLDQDLFDIYCTRTV